MTADPRLVRALRWRRLALVLPCLFLLACIDVWNYPRPLRR
jgi:hypothetical protein